MNFCRDQKEFKLYIYLISSFISNFNRYLDHNINMCVYGLPQGKKKNDQKGIKNKNQILK